MQLPNDPRRLPAETLNRDSLLSPWWLSGEPLARQHDRLMCDNALEIPWDQSTAGELSDEHRARVARVWRARTRAEYLAVSTFEYLSVDMVAAGAPPDILSFCHQAAIDEIRHTEMCLRMTQIYEGETVTPAPDLSGMANDPELPKLHQAITNSMLLNCVVETFACTILAIVLEQTTDPTANAVYKRILSDEIGHARLGWAFLRWGIDTGGDSVIKACSDKVDFVVKSAANVVDAPRPKEEIPDVLRAHGMMHPSEERVIFSDCVREVLAPGFTGLGIDVGNVVDDYGAEWVARPIAELDPNEKEEWQAL